MARCFNCCLFTKRLGVCVAAQFREVSSVKVGEPRPRLEAGYLITKTAIVAHGGAKDPLSGVTAMNLHPLQDLVG